MQEKYKIILFYKYVHIDDTKALWEEQKTLCKRLGFKGRGIIATEGINCTYEGIEANCNEYMSIMKSDPRFADIHWKVSDGTNDGTAFPRLSLKIRNEIVSLHLGNNDDIDPNQITGKHLKPEDLHKWYEEGRKFRIVDMRNDYELQVGKFEGTVFPDLNNFRDLKKNIKKIESIKDDVVLTVCTGGVRCEKASGLLVREGFKDVYQLDGGIVSYMEKYPEKNFKGSLYVFDKRIAMHFGGDKHEVIGTCKKCGVKSEHYVNCANLNCHEHFICCENCLEKGSREISQGRGLAYCNLACNLKWKFYKTKKKIKDSLVHK